MQSTAQLPDGVHGLCSGKPNSMCVPKPEDLQGLPFQHAVVLFLPKLCGKHSIYVNWGGCVHGKVTHYLKRRSMLLLLKCTHLLNYANMTVLAFVITYKNIFFPSSHPTTITNICKPQAGLENTIRKLSLKEFLHASLQSCWKLQVSFTLLYLKRGRLHKAPKGMEPVVSDLSRGTSNHHKMKLEERQSSYYLLSVVCAIQHPVISITEQLLYHSGFSPHPRVASTDSGSVNRIWKCS